MDNWILEDTTLKEPHHIRYAFWEDAAFRYGHGVFETILIANGAPRLIDPHLRRLLEAADKLRISHPYSKETLHAHLQALIQKNKAENAVCNLYLTAGLPHTDGASKLWGILRPMPKSPDAISLDIRPASIERTWLNQFKTMANPAYVLERPRKNFDDVVLLSPEGHLLETPSANVFLIKGNEIHTPNLGAILPGVTRSWLIQTLRAQGAPVIEAPIRAEHLNEYEEIFLTNAIHGVRLVKETLGHPNLQSGPRTHKFKDLRPES